MNKLYIKRCLIVVFLIILLFSVPYFFTFHHLSKIHSDWAEFATYFTLLVSIINTIVISVLSYLVWQSQISRDKFEKSYIEAQEKPAIVFLWAKELNTEGYWKLYNMGKGVALNIIVAERNKDNKEFKNPRKTYTLPQGGSIKIIWFKRPWELGAVYYDIFNQPYNSVCIHDETKVSKKGDNDFPLISNWEELINNSIRLDKPIEIEIK